MGAAAAESRDRVIEQAKAEYEAYTAGRLFKRVATNDAPGGEVEFCGDEDDLAQWNITYVRARDNALVPMTCGDRDRVLEEFRKIDRGNVGFWSDFEWPPPVLLVGNTRHFFQPARGRVLLGVVELVGRTVLLVAVGTRVVAVHMAGGVTIVLPLGRPSTIREVDLDHLLAYYRPRAASRPKAEVDPLRPSSRTHGHHLRIVRGRPVDVGDGPPLTEVLAAIFEDIEVRAKAPKERPPGKLKGKSWVPFVLKYLRKLCVLGCRDLVGLTGEIVAQIQERYPEFEITTEALADVLKLLAATGSGLIAPREDGARIWRIRLAELADPTSDLHKRLCCETWGRCRVDEGARPTPSSEREPPPRGSGRMHAGHADPPRAADGTTPSSGERDSGAQDTPSAHTPSEAATASAPSGDVAERPAAASHAATADRANDESTAAAMRLVDQLSRIPLAGPLLLLWTHTHEFTATVSQLGPVAANGGVEGVEPESGNDKQHPADAGAPAACTTVVGDQHIDEVAAARDSIGDDPTPVDEAGDDQLPVNAGAPAACAVVIGVHYIDEAAAVRDSIIDDQSLAGEAGDDQRPVNAGAPAACTVVSGDQQIDGAAAVRDSSVDDQAPAGEAGAPLGESLAGDAHAACDVIIACAELKPAAHRGRRARTPRSLAAWLLRRAARRPAYLGTLGPRGPPVRASG